MPLPVVTPLACGPAHPELSTSYMDMAGKLLAFTFTFTFNACADVADSIHSAPRFTSALTNTYSSPRD